LQSVSRPMVSSAPARVAACSVRPSRLAHRGLSKAWSDGCRCPAYQEPVTSDLHPMDAALNLPREMYSHGLRRMVAKEAARASFDEVVEIVADYTGTTIGKRQVEELAVPPVSTKSA
jgi:hypothetical protein